MYLPRNGIQIIRMWRVWTFQTLFTSLPLYRHDSNVTNYYLLIWIVIIYRNDFVVKVMFCNTKVDKNFQNKMYTCKVIIRWRLIFCLLFVISAHWHNTYFINAFTQWGKKWKNSCKFTKKKFTSRSKKFFKKKNNGNTATYSWICTYFSHYLTHYEIKSLLFSTPKNVSNNTYT